MSVSDPIQQLQRLAGRLGEQLTRLPVHHLFGRSPGQAERVPGASPGTVFQRTGAGTSKLTALRFDADTVERLSDTSPEALAAQLGGERKLWIDVAGLGDSAALQKLGRLLRVHRLAIADVLNTPQRPKCQRIGDHRLIITQLPHAHPETGEPELGQIALLIGKDYLVSFREDPADIFGPIRDRLNMPDSRLRTEPVEYLAWAVLDLVIDLFYPVVESLSNQIGELEEEAMSQASASLLARIHSHRHSLILIGRVLWRKRDMISSLLRSEEVFPAGLNMYVHDLQDHAVQLLDMVETIRELANSLVEIHLAITNNRLNQVMKTLTIMASIFIPLTFLAGVYGMNFEHMPELAWWWAYPVVLLVMLGVGLGLLFWFWRRGWLKG